MEAGATWLEKAVAACTNCERCHGNFPIDPKDKTQAATDETIAPQIIAEVERIMIDNETDYDPELYDFVYCWRETMRMIGLTHNNRLQAWLKGQFEKKK